MVSHGLEGLVEEYRKRFGVIVGTDLARELFAEYTFMSRCIRATTGGTMICRNLEVVVEVRRHRTLHLSGGEIDRPPRPLLKQQPSWFAVEPVSARQPSPKRAQIRESSDFQTVGRGTNLPYPILKLRTMEITSSPETFCPRHFETFCPSGSETSRPSPKRGSMACRRKLCSIVFLDPRAFLVTYPPLSSAAS
jgi:hypothetical protein